MSGTPIATAGAPIRAFLLDDHEVVRRGLHGLLAAEPGAPGTGVPAEDERLSVLSERERSVLGLVGEGLTDRQIAERLHLSGKTVKNHISRLLGKPGVERRVQAAVIATEVRDHRR